MNYNLSAVGGEASRSLTISLTGSLIAFAIYDTDNIMETDVSIKGFIWGSDMQRLVEQFFTNP